jgi:hypothetical protein
MIYAQSGGNIDLRAPWNCRYFADNLSTATGFAPVQQWGNNGIYFQFA